MLYDTYEYNDYYKLVINHKKYGKQELFLDKDDYDFVKNIPINIVPDKCFNTFYVRCKLGLLHRLITKCPKTSVVDHINHNGLDNRKRNLKVCSQYENIQNQRVRKTNTSGYKNISYDKEREKWAVYFNINKKKKRIGRYNTLEEAVASRDSYRFNLNGEK